MDQNWESLFVGLVPHYQEEGNEVEPLEVPYRLLVQRHVIVYQIFGPELILFASASPYQVQLNNFLVVWLYLYLTSFSQFVSLACQRDHNWLTKC